MKKLSMTQHSEMNMAYKAFLNNRSFRPASKQSGKAIASKGMIATVSVGNGVQHTGLTKRGLEYCRQFFPLFETV